MPLYERDSRLSEITPLSSIVLSNSRVTLLPVLITSLRNDLLIYRLISRRWLPDASPQHTLTANRVCVYVKSPSKSGSYGGNGDPLP